MKNFSKGSQIFCYTWHEERIESVILDLDWEEEYSVLPISWELTGHPREETQVGQELLGYHVHAH